MGKWIALSLVLVSAAVSGCATKNYGRMEPLAAEAAPADCAALEAQWAETQRFRKTVAQESEFSGADVVAFLLDFGIGNAMAKSEALRSADAREAQLADRVRQMKCSGISVHASAQAPEHAAGRENVIAGPDIPRLQK